MILAAILLVVSQTVEDAYFSFAVAVKAYWLKHIALRLATMFTAIVLGIWLSRSLGPPWSFLSGLRYTQK